VIALEVVHCPKPNKPSDITGLLFSIFFFFFFFSFYYLFSDKLYCFNLDLCYFSGPITKVRLRLELGFNF
jgi:hypothetical protein